MKKRSNSYWSSRANKRMDHYQANADKTNKKLVKAYDTAIKTLNSEIDKIYKKFKRDSELTDNEIEDLLNTPISKMERDSLRRSVQNISDEKLKKYLMAKLNAPAYAARISRKEAIKESINIEIKKIAFLEEKLTRKAYINGVNEAYYRHLFDVQKGLGVGFDVSSLDKNTVNSILKKQWMKGDFSSRIWGNSENLIDELFNTIVAGVTAGTPFRVMAESLDLTLQAGKYATERLLKTEMTYFSNLAEMESYKECDIEKYKFLATLDTTTSKKCREMDGKVFEVSEAESSINLPPLHPWCRSTTVAYFDDDTIERIGRRARDPKTGATYVIPKDITYEEWFNKYVVDAYGSEYADSLRKK
ncbi:MAG: minor capsid protein [Sarcina sp.]